MENYITTFDVVNGLIYMKSGNAAIAYLLFED